MLNYLIQKMFLTIPERYLEDLLQTEEETVNTSDQVTAEDPCTALYLDNVINVLRLS